METQRRHDLSIAILLCVPIVSAYVLVGDILYLGWWYYALVLGLPIVLALPFKPRAYFLSGVSFSGRCCSRRKSLRCSLMPSIFWLHGQKARRYKYDDVTSYQ